MRGGDRMHYHGYARHYSRYLMPLVDSHRPITLVEVGILKGTGLAIWCDLFPTSRVVGLDIDLSHAEKNLENSSGRGAFSSNRPELVEFDQLQPPSDLSRIFGQTKIDIVIDDGLHTTESILNTVACLKSYLASEFVYFIEDNDTAHQTIRAAHPGFKVENFGKFTVLTPAARA